MSCCTVYFLNYLGSEIHFTTLLTNLSGQVLENNDLTPPLVHMPDPFLDDFTTTKIATFHDLLLSFFTIDPFMRIGPIHGYYYEQVLFQTAQNMNRFLFLGKTK
jgi:hypothetical protein